MVNPLLKKHEIGCFKPRMMEEMEKNMRADLHCHTMLSDGTLGIEEIIQVAKKSGVDTIAITDHDTLAGTVRAAIIGRRYGITVIPGVEFSCWDSKRERKVHLLCYMPDSPDRLEGLCRRINLARKRAGTIMMVQATSRFPVTADYIKKCGTGSTNIYKQHIMKALMDIGHADSIYGETFKELFVEKGENNISVPIKYPDVFEVLEEILGAGGIPVLAHPYLYNSMELLDELVEKGLAGAEAWHPSCTAKETESILAYAKKHKLLVTGGSDFHGYNSAHHARLGEIEVPEAKVNELLGYKAKIKRAKRKAEKAADRGVIDSFNGG